MSRRGGIDWEAARRRERERAARVPPPVLPRASERSEPVWHLRYMRFPARCEACGEECIKGERAWLRKDGERWLFLHEVCRE